MEEAAEAFPEAEVVLADLGVAPPVEEVQVEAGDVDNKHSLTPGFLLKKGQIIV